MVDTRENEAVTNAEIARAFDQLAVLYELDGAVKYRVLAYEKAASAIRDSPVSVAKMAREGRATELEGIGKTIEEKILDLLERGSIPAADKLLDKFPEGLLEVTEVPGLGPKTVRRLYDELEIASLEDLREAAEAERIQALSGLGAKMEARILEEIERIEVRQGEGPGRLLLSDVLPIAEALADHLRGSAAAERVEIAGSARRLAETCKDIDLVATAEDGLALARRLVEHETIAESGNPSAKGVQAVTHSGVSIDLRIVDPDSFGNLLQHFTGSKDHNVALRERAVAEGFSVSEYGIESSSTGEVARHRDERDVYAHLGYAYIEPELREGRGELDAAREGRLPELVRVEDVRGELHCHTDLSDGHDTLEQMVAAARDRGLEYLAVTDHSASHGFGNHVTADRLRRRIDEVAELNQRLDAEGDSPFRVLAGSEVNIGTDGALDYPEDVLERLDWVIASVHSAFSNDEKVMTERILAAVENPLVDCIGHLTGRLIGKREPYPVDIVRLLSAAAESGTMFEINGNPRRRDLSEHHARMAAEAGVPVVLTTDAHRAESLGLMRYAVATARRAWLTAADVANTRPVDDFLALLR